MDMTTLTQYADRLLSSRLPRFQALPEIDLYMDQLISLLERYLAPFSLEEPVGKPIISPAMVNNYVKLKLLPPPEKKKYSREHIAQLMIIFLLKQTLPLPVLDALIQTQLKECSVSKLYDRFCDQQEAHLVSVSKLLPSASAEAPVTEEIGELALNLAMLSNAARLFAETGAFLAGKTEEPPASEKEAKKEHKKENSKHS